MRFISLETGIWGHTGFIFLEARGLGRSGIQESPRGKVAGTW